MDPYIEDQEWDDFQPSWNAVIAEVLAPALEPRYVARIQRRAYAEQETSPEQRRETYLVIRDVETMEIVTVIETLSPANKRASSDGREQYLEKREEILRSKTNLVELDLLRGGKRLPVVGLPAGDYCAIVSRGHKRPKTDVYHWTLRQALPPIPIPLKKDEPEVTLDLQQVFTTVFDRARYQLSLNYKAGPHVPPTEMDAAWMGQLLAGAAS
jgi:hypothetical protein